VNAMLTDDEIAALMHANHADVFSVLEMHERRGQLYVNACLPGAIRVELLDRSTGLLRGPLNRIAGS